MTSDEGVSQPISETSQSTDSVDEILRTDGRTHEDLSSHPDRSSFTNATRTNETPIDQELVQEWRRYAPATTDPVDILAALQGWLDDWDAGSVRQPIVRTGARTPLCWHLRSMVKRRENWTCRWCGISAAHREIQLDHITPWSAGGAHDTRNLQLLCAECNWGKGNQLDRARKIAPGVTIRCLRCRDTSAAPRGDLVWCFNCEDFSHEARPWVDLAQRFLGTHCDQILRPKVWTREVAVYERIKLLDQWDDWATDTARRYERELRDTLRDLIVDWRAVRRRVGPARIDGEDAPELAE